jgi:acyl-CoA synthetase (AMP-forming)/AMP-acid ligase II
MPFGLVDIWDEHGRPVPLGETGEIVAKADGQMTAFWNNPEATAERMVDGWIKTGDIGRIDRNGYVYIVDRASDMIISGGYNIWPLDIERVIGSHQDIIEVAVFGVPHPKWGETPLAICVVRPGRKITETELIEKVAEELGSYMKPSRIIFQSEPLLRTAVGKVNRKMLRESHWQNNEARVSGS